MDITEKLQKKKWSLIVISGHGAVRAAPSYGQLRSREVAYHSRDQVPVVGAEPARSRAHGPLFS